MTPAQVGALVRGTVLGFPLEARVWSDHEGSLCWSGTLQIQDRGLHHLLAFVDPDLLEPTLDSVLTELVGPVSVTIEIASIGGLRSFSLDTGVLWLRALSRGKSSALALRFIEPSRPPSERLARVIEGVHAVKAALGVEHLLLAFRRGRGLTLSDLSGGAAVSSLPSPLSSSDLLLVGKFAFDGGSAAGRAMQRLFGSDPEARLDLELIAGLEPSTQRFTFCLAIPELETRYLKVVGLHILVDIGAAAPAFRFRGGFVFPLLHDLTLDASCTFTPTSFLLAAEVGMPYRFENPFFESVSFDSAALLIGFAGGLTFGLFGALYVRKFLLFGALVLTMQGQVPVPTLVSGAVGRLSVPSLYESFTGRTIDGLHALDVVAVDGIDLPFDRPFDVDLFTKGDTAKIAAFFNEQVGGEPSLALTPDDIHIRPHDGGYGLVDRQRMRHYLVDSSGAVSLRAQFYYASLKGQFASFSISPGVFLCGTLEVLDKRFVALFSLREGEGILAYARVAPIEIGDFLVLSGSRATMPSPIRLAPGDLVGGLVPPRAEGLVLYLSASKREVTFYFDGRGELLGLFSFDAKLVYAKGKVSIHTRTSLAKIEAVLALDASYDDFMAAKLAFLVRLDTKGLTAALEAVTKRIDSAIATLAKSIQDAQSAIDDARTHVDRLSGEIGEMDRRIAACQKDIADASPWAKPFVAIGKGAEITAYEVAKAALWTAIKTAQAGLGLAEKAVGFFGHLGAGLLELVHTAIRTASSLLFLRHAEISASLDVHEQRFSIDVAFVALGEEHSFRESVSRDVLRDDLLPFLTGRISGLLEPQLQEIEQGRAMGGARALSAEGAPVSEAEVPDIRHASTALERASTAFGRLRTLYRERLGEDLSDFDALRTSFLSALQRVDNALYTAAPPARTIEGLSSAIRGLDSGHLSDEDRGTLEEALSVVERASALRGAVTSAADVTAKAREALAGPPLPLTEEAPPSAAARALVAEEPRGPDDRMRRFLDEVEDVVGDIYPVEEIDRGYINLSMEPRVAECFSAARSLLAGAASAEEGAGLRAAARATARGITSYRPRL